MNCLLDSINYKIKTFTFNYLNNATINLMARLNHTNKNDLSISFECLLIIYF